MSYEVTFVDLQEQPAAVVREQVPHEKIAAFLGAAFGEVLDVATRQDLPVVGAPFARYRVADKSSWHVEAGFPVRGAASPEGRVVPTALPGGRVAQTLHVGDYGTVGAAYEFLLDRITENGYVAEGDPWESYLDGPEVTNPRTHVFVPCHRARPHHPDGSVS
jgi:effector-binding domain-containing protein